jgi:hypothetical protein
MISYIDARLVSWAEQVGRGGVYLRGQGSILGKLIDSGGVLVRSTGGAPCMDLQSEEIEKCVNQLPTDLRIVVLEFYLSFDSTPKQKAKALNLSRMTLYRRVDSAHNIIDGYLRSARVQRVSQPYPQVSCQR